MTNRQRTPTSSVEIREGYKSEESLGTLVVGPVEIGHDNGEWGEATVKLTDADREPDFGVVPQVAHSLSPSGRRLEPVG